MLSPLPVVERVLAETHQSVLALLHTERPFGVEGTTVHTVMPPARRGMGMGDTKEGRENQADDEERRQREREMAEARERADEPDPTADDRTDPDEARRGDDETPASPRECHRRGCSEPAAFLVRERYQEETGHGPVEAEAALCREHTAEESPTNLDGVYPDYVFRVDPIPEPRTGDGT